MAGAAQASLSGALGRRVGTIGSAGFGVVFAAILVVALALALGRGGSIAASIHHPAWLWLGGLFGAAIVLAIAYAPPRIGTFATVALLIAGQLAAGALIDAFGWLGSPRIPVTVARARSPFLRSSGTLSAPSLACWTERSGNPTARS